MLSFIRPETLTQAYHAGVIVSQIENYLPKENIPPLGVCLAKFQALRELLGERLWQKLKSRKQFTARIRIYEALTYQPYLPREMIGTSKEFCLGYVTSYKHSSRKRKQDRLVEIKSHTILNHLKKTIPESELLRLGVGNDY